MEEQRNAERGHWRAQGRIGWTTVVVSAIAASAALAGLFLAIDAANEARRQADAAVGQLRIMRAEQRPWIKVEPTKIGDFLTYGGLDGPQAVLNVSFKLTNVGKNPAVGIRFLAWGFAGPLGGSANPSDPERC